jgi:hypothetical protein
MFLTFHQTSMLRRFINEEQDFPYKYFATDTWSKETLSAMRAKVMKRLPAERDENVIIRELQQWRENQANRRLASVSRKTNVHISALISFELAENPHVHYLLMTDKPIPRSIWKKEWRHGEMKDFQVYNPSLRKTENGVVGYVMGWGNNGYYPPKHRARMNTKVFCPKKRRCCRNGNCPHKEHFQWQLNRVLDVSREEEAQMQKDWIEAGDWRLREWRLEIQNKKIISEVKQGRRSLIDESQSGEKWSSAPSSSGIKSTIKKENN